MISMKPISKLAKGVANKNLAFLPKLNRWGGSKIKEIHYNFMSFFPILLSLSTITKGTAGHKYYKYLYNLNYIHKCLI